jgi:hypothetical protein
MGCWEESGFAAGKLGGEISHFKRDVRNLPDQIKDRRVRFETHPLHAKFVFLVADDKEFQLLQVSLARLHFSSGEFRCDGTGALFFALRGVGTNSTASLPRLKTAPSCPDF